MPFLESLNERYENIARSKRTYAPRVTLICDREWLNLHSLIEFGNTSPELLEVGGIIVPGGEFDPEIIHLADSVRDMKSHGIGMPIMEKDNTVGFQFYSPNSEFSYHHTPYDASQLRTTPEYRRKYCEQLAEVAAFTNPNLIFLSNFKVILDPVFIEKFKGKVVSIHPSILPLLKGFRPELRADEGEDPQALGYTIHLVDEDLDGGPTIFQQSVSLEPYDYEEENCLGSKDYKRMREERHRLKIISAQARYTPVVLALLVLGAPYKVVENEEAFEAEERSKIEIEPDGKPYRRVLFNISSGWQTAEAILKAPRESLIKTPDVMTEYIFTIEGNNQETVTKFMKTVELAETIRENRGGGYLRTRMQYYPQDAALRGSIYLPYDLSGGLTNLDIPYETRIIPTRVLAQREPIIFIT